MDISESFVKVSQAAVKIRQFVIGCKYTIFEAF